MVSPLLPPVLEHSLGVPVAGFLGVEPLPVGVQPPHGGHDVGVGIGRVLEVVSPVGHHAQGDQFVLDEPTHQGDSLVVIQFDRHRHFHFPGHLGVHALLAKLNPVPQGWPVLDPGRGLGGGKDFGHDDAVPVRVIEPQAGPVVRDAGAGPVRRCSSRRPSRLAADDLDGVVVDGHGGTREREGKGARNGGALAFVLGGLPLLRTRIRRMHK